MSTGWRIGPGYDFAAHRFISPGLGSKTGVRPRAPTRGAPTGGDQPSDVSNDGSGVRNILIIRPGAIGDTLLTFPSIRLLRRYFPSARITVIGNRPALDLARLAGLADAVDAFGADWFADLFGDELTPALRDRLTPFDLGIVWMHSPAAAADLAARLEAGGVRRVVALVSFPAAGSGRHVADHLVDTLGVLGMGDASSPLPTGEGEGEGHSSVSQPRPDVPRPWNGTPLTLALSRGERGGVGPLVVLHPGAGARRKRWPTEKYAWLGERFVSLGYRLAVTSGPADEEAVSMLSAALREPPLILRGLDLTELAATLSRASLVVGNDSGITHLAALVGAPTVAIFGPFDPAYWAPIGPRVAVVDGGTVCSHRQDPREGCRQCDLLASVAVSQVWDAAAALLGSSDAESSAGWYDLPRKGGDSCYVRRPDGSSIF